MSDFIRQSGAICLLNGKVVLLTNRGGRRWVIPKGHMEPGDSCPSARAEAEAWEEAGVRGLLQRQICGHFHYRKNGGLLYRVDVFLLLECKLAEEWPEKNERTRIIVSPAEAAELVWEPELKALLAALSL